MQRVFALSFVGGLRLEGGGSVRETVSGQIGIVLRRRPCQIDWVTGSIGSIDLFSPHLCERMETH